MLILIIGPSGCGKSSVIKKLGYPYLLSTTTREIRDGEIEGEEYVFVSKGGFNDMIQKDEFSEYTEYSGNLYGFQCIHADKCNNSTDVYIAAVDTNGVLAMREYLGSSNVFAISITASEDNLRKWMKKRGDSDKNIEARINNLNDTKEIHRNNHYADAVIESVTVAQLTKDINELIIKRLRIANNGFLEARARA